MVRTRTSDACAAVTVAIWPFCMCKCSMLNPLTDVVDVWVCSDFMSYSTLGCINRKHKCSQKKTPNTQTDQIADAPEMKRQHPQKDSPRGVSSEQQGDVYHRDVCWSFPKKPPEPLRLSSSFYWQKLQQKTSKAENKTRNNGRSRFSCSEVWGLSRGSQPSRQSETPGTCLHSQMLSNTEPTSFLSCALFAKASSPERCFHSPFLPCIRAESLDGCGGKCGYGFCSRRGSKWD